MTYRCNKCGRRLLNPSASGYGPVCAKLAGLMKPQHALADPLTADLFIGIDLEGAALLANEVVRGVIDAAAGREIAAMRAAWGRAT